MKHRRAFTPTLALLAFFAFSTGATVEAAEPLPEPEGPVILEISGKITRSNKDGKAAFDAPMLRAVSWATLDTHTNWTEGIQSFEGVPLQDLLDYVGAEGDTLKAVALNDYFAMIPASDAKEFSVLAALVRNGEPMQVRDNGPIWIIYPSVTEGDMEPTNEKMVWQLKEIIVE